MSKNILLVFGIIAIIILLVIFMLNMPSKKGSISILRVGWRQYDVEIADTMMKQVKGLSSRSSLASANGMLFVFASSSMQSFWMHGMLIPLDFVWINQGQVIGITENVSADSKAIYRSPQPANQVLELNAGVVARDGIKVGDIVELKI